MESDCFPPIPTCCLPPYDQSLGSWFLIGASGSCPLKDLDQAKEEVPPTPRGGGGARAGDEVSWTGGRQPPTAEGQGPERQGLASA